METTKPIQLDDKSIKQSVFFEMLDVPVYCNLLWSDQQGARNCPKGDIRLVFYPDTGMIKNIAFDPSKLGYSQDYENSLHYSPRFQQYAQSLADSLVSRHDLYDKDIIEIGSGKGDFLVSLCELGNNRGVGFDPSYIPRTEHGGMNDRVKFIQDFYSDKYQEYKADLICCRQTLEHIPNPSDLLIPLRKAIGDSIETAVFFEVPNGLHTFRNMAIWDIIYEHCCYFVPISMEKAFASCGFQVQLKNESFGGQFLCLEALPSSDTAPNTTYDSEHDHNIQSLLEDISTFTGKFDALVKDWGKRLAEIKQSGKKVVAWGAGSKGVTFLNIFKEYDVVQYIVDLNPRKTGMYVAGTGQEIVQPDFLKEYQPDIVIIMNPIYENEIKNSVMDMGIAPEFLSA
ncbi:MAG: methyltransferase domain-containing protein [Cyanobacteria bacterium P01_F01_bin.150]